MSRKPVLTVAGLAAGVAGFSVASQSPPNSLPIPELPKVGIEFKPLPAPSSQTAAIPPIPQPDFLPPITEAIKPQNNLQPVQSGHNFKQDGEPRETLPAPGISFPAIPPSPPLIFPMTPPREVPDMRFDKAIFTAALGAALAGSPAIAQDNKDKEGKIPAATDGEKKNETSKPAEEAKPVDLKKELESVKTLLESLTAKQKQIGDAVLGQGEGKDADAGVVKKLDNLSASIKTLDETVKKLEDKMTKLGENVEKVRVANSSPLANKDTSKETVKTSGIVKLINGYGDRVTMIVNGRSHRLEAGETKDVTVPSGKFEYALPLAGGELKSSVVKDNEIVTLRIK